MREHVLDLDRRVPGDTGVACVQRARDSQGVRGGIQKVWTAKADVARTCLHLVVDVGEDDVVIESKAASLIDGRYRAVPAWR